MKKILGGFVAILLALCGFVVALGGGSDAAQPQGGGSGGGLKSGVIPNKAWEPYVRAAGGLCKSVSPGLVAAQIETESNWNPKARNAGSGAAGLSQFVPGTWAAFGADGNGDGKKDPYEPADAIKAQGVYMCALEKMMIGWLKAGRVKGPLVHLMLAGYNAGEGNVQKFGGVPPFNETRNYIPKILGLAKKYASSGGTTGGGGDPSKRTDCPDGKGQLVGANHGRTWLKGKLVALGKKLQGEGWKVGEHPDFGGVAPVHGKDSLHDFGLAFDMNGPGEQNGAADKLARKLWNEGWGVQWKVNGHYNHLHVDVGLLGGLFGGPQFERNPNADKLGTCETAKPAIVKPATAVADRPVSSRPSVQARSSRPAPSRPRGRRRALRTSTGRSFHV